MKKYIRVCAAVAMAASVLTFTNTAVADIVGLQLGHTEFGINAESASSTSIGGFAQWRKGNFGIHIAVSGDSIEDKQTLGSGGRVYNTDTIRSRTSLDVLGTTTISGDGVNWVGMFGLSTIEIDTTSSSCFTSGSSSTFLAFCGSTNPNGRHDTTQIVATSDRLIGWKIAGGAEFALSENWVLQTMVEYADLGSFPVANSLTFGVDRTFNRNLTETNLIFNIGYRF